MIRYTGSLLAIASISLACVAYARTDAGQQSPSGDQTTRPRSVAGVQEQMAVPTLEVTGGVRSAEAVVAPTKVATAPAYVSAAAVRNTDLSRSITWAFGGKQQRGWHLYVPLIQQLVSTDAEPGSEEFARAVTSWKRTAGVPAGDGCVDAACWQAMFKSFQSARTYELAPPPDAELVQTPAEQWLFPERPAELRMLRRDAYAAYLKMAADARRELGPKAAGDYFKLISGFRSRAYQQQLRAQAGGNPSTASLAKNSPHTSGRALDLFVGGYDPISTKDDNRALQIETPAYRWLAKNAHKYGFRPYFYEPWHWEFDPALAAAASTPRGGAVASGAAK